MKHHSQVWAWKVKKLIANDDYLFGHQRSQSKKQAFRNVSRDNRVVTLADSWRERAA